MAEEQVEQLHVMVKGKVQGVSFRNFVQSNAQFIGVGGWVRNVGLDEVELRAEGSKSKLEALLSAVSKGARASYVDTIFSEWLPPSDDHQTFVVFRTLYEHVPTN